MLHVTRYDPQTFMAQIVGPDRGHNYLGPTVMQALDQLDIYIGITEPASALETFSAPNTKGSFGSECNRSACKNVPATWKHRDLHNRYYCQTCGPWINEQNGEQLCSPVNR
jgi:hypothetical protein